MSNQATNNNLNYLIDPTCTKVNRLFVVSFENEEDRFFFSKYCVPKIEIKFTMHLFFDWKLFFKIPVKSKDEATKHMDKLLK